MQHTFERPTGLALYVHWPWCQAKCPYCDFNSHTTQLDMVEAYQSALLHELDTLPWANLPPPPLVSVFFGGGTPSLMGAARIAALLHHLDARGYLAPTTEITVECNPTSSPAGLFAELRAVGVNRVSLGIQSLTDTELRFLGREHALHEALVSLDAAQHHFANVNADVIYGLPEQHPTRWGNMLAQLATRGLQHISAYQLTVEKNTAFYSAVKRGAWQQVSADTEADFFETTQQVLSQHGYQNYEMSNFARPGYACRHNVHVWQYGAYVGVGAGAHGRVHLPDATWATQNPKMPTDYITRCTGPRLIPDFLAKRLISRKMVDQEALMMGLRLRDGLVYADAPQNAFKVRSEAPFNLKALEQLRTLGFVEQSQHRLCLTPKGWPLLDTLLRELLDA